MELNFALEYCSLAISRRCNKYIFRVGFALGESVFCGSVGELGRGRFFGVIFCDPVIMVN